MRQEADRSATKNNGIYANIEGPSAFGSMVKLKSKENLLESVKTLNYAIGLGHPGFEDTM